MTSSSNRRNRSTNSAMTDLVGQTPVTVVLGSVVFAVIESVRLGWTSPIILALLAVAALGVLGILGYEPRRADPLLELRLFRSVPFTSAIAMALFALCGFGAFLFVQWDDAVPGFVGIDLVGHEGGNAIGDHAYTLTVTDIASGWTENRSVRNKAEKWVFAALVEIRVVLPFPLLGIDSDNGSEFINWHLLRWCEQEKITSPARGRATATTGRMWSRRTGPSCAPWWAITATTPPQNCWCLTKFERCSR